jgi:hypothetical protein
VRDLYEQENRHTSGKATEVKAKVRMLELQLEEYQSVAKDSISNNMDVVEGMHLKYFEEIRSLN